ncbi:hypothetical protein Tco_0944560 [Tanacetum coccineum]
MIITEDNLYVAKQGLENNLLNNHNYGFTPQFFTQPPNTPNTPVDKKDFEFDKILEDLFIIGADNLKRMGQDIVQDSICKQDTDLKEKQEKDGDDRNFFYMWDITVEDVERIRQFFTPNVPDVMVNIIQPLIPKTIYTTPPDEDYVAPATKSILDDLLEEFGDEILNVAMVNEGAECSPTKDLEEVERLLAKDPQSYYTEIQVYSVIINPEPFLHTQLTSLLYVVFKTSKPCKVDRDIITPVRYDFYSPFHYPIETEHLNDVYCYFHPHLIPSEGKDTQLPSK